MSDPSGFDRLIPPEIKDDPLYVLIERLAAEPTVRTMLEIGSSAGEGSTAAFVAGIRASDPTKQLFCMEVSKARFDALRQRYAADAFVKPFNVSSVPAEKFPSEEQVARFYRSTPTALNHYPLEQVLSWLRADVDYLRVSQVQQNGIEQIKHAAGIGRFDLVLIDGSEFTGSAELDLVHGAGLILLDDTRAYKNYDNFQRLFRDPQYQLIVSAPAVRNGFALFKRMDFTSHAAERMLPSTQRTRMIRGGAPPVLRGPQWHVLVWSDDAEGGGVAQFNHSITRGLASAGYRVTLVQSANQHPHVAEREGAGIQHHFLDYDCGKNFWRTQEEVDPAAEILRRHAPDVILFSDCAPQSNLAAKRAAQSLGIDFITVTQYVDDRLHNIRPDLLSHLRNSFRDSRFSVAVSHENLGLLHRNFGLPSRKGSVIHYGRPEQFFLPRDVQRRQQVRNALNIPDDATACFTAARLEGVKGFQYQVEAIRRLKDRPVWEKLYFIWAGAGSLEQELRRALEEMGALNHVKLVGMQADVLPYLEAADVFVLPSHAEGMPLAVMEAMAKGLAVVASSVSGIPEELGDTGQLITSPNEDAAATVDQLAQTLEQWATDPAQRNEVGEACAARAEKMFRERRMVDDYLRLIERALLPKGDYAAPALEIIAPDLAFPNMIVADKHTCPWPYLRKNIPHNWYVDQRQPTVGFSNRDEASILYNVARQFSGKRALEIGAWVGWSACHLALGGVQLDLIDPLQAQVDFAKTVRESLSAAGVMDRVNIIAGSSPQAVVELAQRENRRWSLIFIDGNHDRPAPLEDTKACLPFAEQDAAILFHDLASPEVSEGLDHLRDQGWNTIIFQTAQIMGMAWRGDVSPPPHVPDPLVHWTVPEHLKGYAVSGARESTIRDDPLPVHFFTLVLNGEPFIRHHIEQFKQLPFDWHWHIIEGAAELKHDTAWSVRHGGKLSPEFHRDGLSIDGTTEYLDALEREFPGRITVYRKKGLWEGKREMVGRPLGNIDRECLLWEVDVDELWTSEQFIRGRDLFLQHPEKTGAFYWCWFFVGPDRVITTRGGYGNNPAGEWLRTWRYRPGMAWAAHEPPVLAEAVGRDQWRDAARVNPFTQDQTEQAGLVFQHYAYVTLEQVRFKQSYYGYKDALAKWAMLQYARPLPARLRDFLPWVRDETMVGRAEGLVPTKLFNASLTTSLSSAQPAKPTIIVDGTFFEIFQTGIARVWWSLLTEWVRSGFARHVIVLDRAGTFPPMQGIRRRIVQHHYSDALEEDRRVLQDICDEEGADVFISTYYSTPLRTPSVLLVHDMIPEVLGQDLNQIIWQEKAHALKYAREFVAVSENTKKDLLKHMPSISSGRVTVAHPGVWPVFSPASAQQIDNFRTRFNLDRPYFLCVGLRGEYKNTSVLFEAISRLADPKKYLIVCAGSDKVLHEKYVPLVNQGILRFIGQVDDATLATAYSGATALVYPSLYEGFGLPIIEAFACGCPVITSNKGSIPEVAGDAVLTIDPSDPEAIAQALETIQEPELRARLIDKGLERVKRFRWDEMARKLGDVLLSVASAR
ncbi:MAG TPA: glycosyltransferase [Tepidisphaeraceae bacterium]|jgi:glycosyltransferase involved in cell wall biosynthesis/predicted O-methyltransferase YrrM